MRNFKAMCSVKLGSGKRLVCIFLGVLAVGPVGEHGSVSRLVPHVGSSKNEKSKRSRQEKNDH